MKKLWLLAPIALLTWFLADKLLGLLHMDPGMLSRWEIVYVLAVGPGLIILLLSVALGIGVVVFTNEFAKQPNELYEDYQAQLEGGDYITFGQTSPAEGSEEPQIA